MQTTKQAAKLQAAAERERLVQATINVFEVSREVAEAAVDSYDNPQR